MIITYSPGQRLELTFAALGIPLAGTSYDPTATPPLSVTYAPDAAPAQIDQGNTLLASWDMRIYRTRTLSDLIAALQALTAAQKTNISNDLFSGSPFKVLTDTSSNESAIYVLYYNTQTGGTSASDKNLAKLYAASLYVQDNPVYLIQPTFDSSINVPGWEPIP